MTADAKNANTEGTPALRQGFAVLNALIEAGRLQGISQLCQATGLSKASVYRLLRSFGKMGYVFQDPANKQYGISPSLFGFISQLTRHFLPTKRATFWLREAALKFDYSIYISMLAEDRTFVIAASGPYGDTATLGASGMAYATASGKAIIAHLPEEQWNNFAPHPDSLGATPWTHLDPKHFIRELQEGRQRGVFFSERENNKDYSAMAVPVFGPRRTVQFALAFLMPFELWQKADKIQMESELKAFAADLSSVLYLCITSV